MSPPPESSRRAMRERRRLRAERATGDPSTMPVFGDSLGPELAVTRNTERVNHAQSAEGGDLADAAAADAEATGAEATDADGTDAETTDADGTNAAGTNAEETDADGTNAEGRDPDGRDPADQEPDERGPDHPGAHNQSNAGQADHRSDDLHEGAAVAGAAVNPLDEASHLTDASAQPPAATSTEWADEDRPPTALTWLEPSMLVDEHAAATASAPLFDGARLTPEWRRPRILFPVGIVTALCAAYVSTTLLWPLHEVAPTPQATTIEIAPAPAAAVTWPAKGSAAVGIQGMPPVASTTSADEIASISKVVSVMMVLDELPLKVGEQGPSFDFTYADSRDYWSYRRSNQSSLDVPVGGSLTQYQMLQGIMLGSANNYIDRLADELWGSQRGFSEAAARWLSDRGIEGVTLVSPSGFSKQNVATPAALIQIAELAMAHPVFAEIVATRSAEIPGVGTVINTNKMLDDAGVVGIKTGTLSHWNLLTAKDVTVGDTTVRLFSSVLGQESGKARLAATRQLLSDVEQALAAQPPSVPAGTVVGHVTTEWGERVEIVTDADARVLLWNGASATASTEFALGDAMKRGSEVGVLTAEGPLDTAETSVSLAADIEEPTAWWRLTHPLELFGLDKD